MIRRLGWILAVVVLFATGVYTVVYLYRWEWNRALFTSVLFITIEVALVGVFLLNRIRRIETDQDGREVRNATLGRIEQTRPDRAHFAWLERSMNRTSVFVTVLLGAGVLLSLGTWLIDRIAPPDRSPEARAGPRTPARAAGLSRAAARPGRCRAHRRSRPLRHGPPRDAARAAAMRRFVGAWPRLLVALGAAVLVLRQLAMTVHTPMPAGSYLEVRASARWRDSERGAHSLARALTVACVTETAAGTQLHAFSWRDGSFRFSVAPAFDEADRRQLRGCMSDLRMPGLIVSVQEMQTVPAPGEPR